MALSTFSSFYYDYTITASNNIINVNEGTGDVAVEINIGSYTAEGLAVAVANALNGSLTNVYTVSVDRLNRRLTISADANFDLLIQTGLNIGLSAYPALGFTGSDVTGSASYTSNIFYGKEFLPQFVLQDYKGPGLIKSRISSSVNEAASGSLEVVSFGVREIIQFSLKYITDLKMDNKVIKNNQNGLQNTIDFLTYLSTRGPLEFMPNDQDKDSFLSIVVEEMPGGKDGTGYELTELVGQNLPNFYEINNIKCRVI